MRLELGYPDTAVFRAILDDVGQDRPGRASSTAPPESELSQVHIVEMIECANQLPVAPLVRDYIVELVEATRDPKKTVLGASPRAGLALLRAARAFAAGHDATEVSIDHVRHLAPHVLAHRVILRNPPAADVSKAQVDCINEVVDSIRTRKTWR
jgi:MoxR-like ATPase